MSKNVIHRDTTHIKVIAKHYSNFCEPGDTVIFHKCPSGWRGYNTRTEHKCMGFISNIRNADLYILISQWHKELPMAY